MKVEYQLHPPALRCFGVDRKVPASRAYDVAFAALEKMKRLRGTKLDPFGWHPDRKLERAVIEEYEALVRDVVLDASVPCGHRVEAATSIQSVKGYAAIKDEAVARWRAEVRELRDAVKEKA